MYEQPPHVFAIAENAFRSMVSEQRNQCVIISGESGAGKTEASKQVMQYVAAVANGSESGVDELKEQILGSNPVLEAFGNAKTLRNNNSSRFGKYMELLFDFKGVPLGGKITNYLLEKSRVVKAGPGERNFHIFYQLLAGADKALRSDLRLGKAEDYVYLNRTGSFEVDGMEDKEEYAITRDAMTSVGMTDEEQVAVLRVVAGVLHLGNMAFLHDDKAQTTSVTTRDELSHAAHCFGTTEEKLESALCFRTITTAQPGAVGRGSAYAVPQNQQQSEHARDALAKAIYSRLFDWLVQRINQSIACAKWDVVIGVLDIYGFEIFETNNFEQLCINYVNEKLQQIFLELTLKAEQDEYDREGIAWEHVDFIDNKPCVELVEKKMGGIFSMLDEECVVPNGSDEKLCDKMHSTLASHKSFAQEKVRKSSSSFALHHYAGTVQYETTGFVEKNKDTLFGDLIRMGQMSSVPLVQALFAKDDADQKKRPPTAGYQFKNQVLALCETLTACHPHYIRCIKPNEEKKAKVFTDKRVQEQVRYLGLLENVRVRRAGYAYRQTFQRFLARYKMLSPWTWPHCAPDEDITVAIEALLSFLGIVKPQFAMGKTKVFIRQPQTLFGIEELRERKLHDIATIIQSAYRSYRIRKLAMALREAAKEAYKMRKERRRGSASHSYFGDYLRLGEHPNIAKLLARFSDSGTVKFSSDIRKLKPRSAGKFQARIVMLGQSALYVLGPKGYKLHKRVTLAEIGGVSLSPFQDNIIVVHTPEGVNDLVIDCEKKTELMTLLNELRSAAGLPRLDVRIENPIKQAGKKGQAFNVHFEKDETCGSAQISAHPGAKQDLLVKIATGMRL